MRNTLGRTQLEALDPELHPLAQSGHEVETVPWPPSMVTTPNASHTHEPQ